ncbi:MAG: Methyltransferase type 11 [Verrucomicrobia bacterium]|nr:Methyltransferase type 11 [Verrucomicrobiota bacterium]
MPPAILTSDLRARVENFDAWYHEIDFGNGVRSQPKHPHHDIWKAIDQFLAPLDFRGKTVLDVGCWDGAWSFLAERRGAASVLATDDNSQHWTRVPAGIGTNESPEPGPGFQLAREALGSRVAYRGDVSAYHLDRLGERFDVVLFLGVFYHLTHLMSALTQLRHAVKPGGVVILEGAAINDHKKSSMDFLYGPEDGFGGTLEPERADPSNWSIPTIRCLHDMLNACYFDVKRLEFQPQEYIRGRVLMEARPVVFSNPQHIYRPPFGLDRYDTRFATHA